MANNKGRNSDLEREERILYILQLRSKGVKATSDLLRFFASEYPKISKRQFEYDLKKAKDLIAEHFEEDVQFQVAEITKHYWELYSKNLKLQDYRECRAILSELSKLKGLIIDKRDHTSNGKSISPPKIIIGD